MATLPVVEPGGFVRRRLVVVAPHPDDESLGCGGLIAACRAAGVPVSIVVVSDGAGSHPHSVLYAAPRLAELRRAEALEAARRLSVAPQDVHFLDLPDRFVPVDGPDAERASAWLAALCTSADVVAVSWRHDPHTDHKASFALAQAALREVAGAALWEYPIWGLTLPPPTILEGPPVAGVRVRVDGFRDAKRHAVAAHASQTTGLIADDPGGFRLTPEVLSLFDTPFETYLGPAT
ncbi:PIG-L deacetylase family protein [Ancylobacter sp.]|uniref:PIG-L deacetylase family protein n=1 Tax=Ancylobacter sp. TaxID=1872567 RepID=UPI003D0AA360